MGFDPNRIDFSKIADQFYKYERMWIAISEDNQIVSSGATYAETLKRAPDPDRVILFKVPPLDYALAP